MTVPDRRQQVFVSSTYLDLKAERQAAVQAILNAGHIPAGMELFAAGDQSQLELIKRWIEDSDIFMLILGARYGSIEKNSGKSYIQLEYEHALSLGKPYFAVYMTDEYRERRVKGEGSSIIEQSEPGKLKEFRDVVMSKHCSAFGDLKDIELAVHKALPGLIRDHKLRGWVRAGATNEVSTLINQIRELQERVNSLQSLPGNDFNGASFDEVCQTLRAVQIPFSFNTQVPVGDGLSVLLTAFRHTNQIYIGVQPEQHAWAMQLERFGLASRDGPDLNLLAPGHRFLNRLKKTLAGDAKGRP